MVDVKLTFAANGELPPVAPTFSGKQAAQSRDIADVGKTISRTICAAMDEDNGRCPNCGEDEMDGGRCYYCGFHEYDCGDPDCKFCAAMGLGEG